MADALMRAYIQLRADDTGLRADAQSKVTAATAGVEGKAKVTLDKTQLEKDRKALLSSLSDLGARATVIRAKLDADDKAGLAKIAAFQVKLMALDSKAANVKIGTIGAARAEAQILALQASMDRMEKTGEAGRGSIAGLVGEITGFGAVSGLAAGQGEKFRLALTAINLATGVLEPAMAGLIVGAAGLGAAFASAGAGIAVFGAIAKSAITQASQASTKADAAQVAYTNSVAKANLAYQQAIAGATTAKQRQSAETARTNALQSAELTRTQALNAAYQGMGSAQMSLAKSISVAKDSWKDFVADNTAGVAQVMSAGVGLLPRVFELMAQFMKPVSTALTTIMGEIRAGIAPGTQFSQIMKDLAASSGGALYMGLHAAGNILMGLLGVVHAFLPEGLSLLQWVVDATAKFKEWGLTLQSHAGFQSLMQMFRTETPQAMAILRNLGEVILNIGKAMTGLSTFSNSKMLLNALLPLSGILNDLSQNKAFVNLALYALAFHAALGKLAPAITMVKGAVQAWTEAQRLLDVALNANVIGLVVIAIAALAVGMYEAWKRSSAFRDVMKTVASGFLEAGQIIVGGAKFILDSVLGLFGSIVHGAATAFGWVPGLGGKLKGAAAAFDSFKAGVDNAMQGAINKMQQWQDSLNTAVSTSRNATNLIVADFNRQNAAAGTARAAVGNYTTAIQQNGVTSSAAKGARDTLVSDLVRAGVNANTARADVANYTTAIQQNGINSDAARAARSRLISDIVSTQNNSRTGRADLAAYSAEVAANGTRSDAARAARTRLIGDLVAAGVDSRTARGLVDQLGSSITHLPASKKAQIIMQGTGSYLISQTTSATARPAGSPAGKAAGGRVTGPGSGTSDTAGLYALSNNEWVIRAASARRYGGAAMSAVNEGRAVIGYAAGGPVPVTGMAAGGSINMGNATPSYVNKMYSDFQNRFTAAMVAAMRAAIKAARDAAAAAAAAAGAPGAAGGPTSASAAQAQAYARSRLGAYGWGPDQMGPLIRLWNQESGWNRLARNPSSGAYGIPQALPPSKMGAAANPPTSSAAAQINWGLGYIKTRPGYGSPAAAWAHEVAYNWYDTGGWLPPGASVAVNRSGRPERVLPPGGGDDLSRRLDRLIAQVERLTEITAMAPARTGQHVGAAMGGTAAAAAFRSRYPQGAY